MECESMIKGALFTCAVCLIAGILYTFPMIMHFGDGIPYTRYGIKGELIQHGVGGDHYQLYYRFWLFKDVLNGNSRLFEDKYEFSTEDGASFPVGSYFMPYPFIFNAFDWLGNGAGYNAVIIASYVFSGLSMYLLLFLYTKDSSASLLGGLIFALAPYRMTSVLSGHPTGLSMFFVPLFIYLLEKTLQEKSSKWGVGAGIVFVLLADNDLHTLYVTMLITPFFVIRHFFRVGWHGARTEVIRLILPGIAVAILCAAAVFLKINRTPVFGSDVKRELSEVVNYTPDLRC